MQTRDVYEAYRWWREEGGYLLRDGDVFFVIPEITLADLQNRNMLGIDPHDCTLSEERFFDEYSSLPRPVLAPGEAAEPEGSE
jgi:hypothetical protein